MAREIHPGDKLHISNDSGDFDIEVLTVSDIWGVRRTWPVATSKAANRVVVR